MVIDNGRAFDEARLLERLLVMLGANDAGNGTPLANAAASAIAVDMRASGAKSAALDQLDDRALIEAICKVQWALNEGGNFAFDLPFGTKATSRRAGGLKIGAASYVLDAGRPGLHPAEITRQDAHGPNLDRLRRMIERKTRRLACRRLGLPGGSSIANNEMRHNLQFAPCPEAGGVVLQRRATETGADRFCAALPKQLDAFADDIVRDMRELWRHRAVIGGRVDAVRRAAEARIQVQHGPEGPVAITAIAVELCGETGDKPVSLYVEMDSLDEALRPGKVLEHVPARDDTDCEWFRFNDSHAPRASYIAELASLGATGRISDVAEGVAAAAPEGRAAVLARLDRELETQVVLPTASGDLYATLFWQNGFIEAEVSIPGLLDILSTRIELHVALPDTILTAIVGRPISDVVDLPFRLRTPVEAAEETGYGWLRITVREDHSLVNCGSGEIWPEPDVRRHATS